MNTMRIFYYVALLGLPFIAGLVWWVWADGRLRAMTAGLGRGGARLFMAVFIGLFTLCYVWMAVTRWVGLDWAPPPWIMGYMLLWGLLFLPFMALPAMGLWAIWCGGGWAARCVRRRVRAMDVPPAVETAVSPPQRMSRRQMIAATALSLPMLATLGTTAWGLAQTRRFQVTRYRLRVVGLPAALEGLTIAHVSDVHVGKFTQPGMLDRIADATNELQADLVLITGDIIDTSLDDLPAALRMIDRIDPRSGLLLCEGNHDLFDDKDEFRKRVRRHGLPLLVDEAQTVTVRGTPVQVMGIAWHGRGRPMEPHVDRVAALRDDQAFPILLAHHPDAFDRAAEHGLPLTLSGHTHGGQIMLSDGFGAGPLMFKYWTGVYRQRASTLVVSNGVGDWFPLRTSAPAELVHLTLHRA